MTLPPLRDRAEDIPLLAAAFLKEFAEENGKPEKELSSEAMRALLNHRWPGNVRELRTAIEHGVVMSNGPKITLRHLPASVTGGGDARRDGDAAGAAAADSPDRFDLAAAERRLIGEALAETGGNRTEAAKLLGISRRTLQRKLKEQGEAHAV
jgi:DNA-binding NtrC family response regulator